MSKALLFLAIIFWLTCGLYYVFYSDTSIDEGNLLYKSFLSETGKDKLYSDGGSWTEYMPGGYLFYGATQLFGINFYLARMASYVIGFLNVVLIYLFTKRLFGNVPALLSLCFLVLNSSLLQSFSVAYFYSISSFYLSLALVFLSSNLKYFYKIILTIFFTFLSVFIRSTMIPTYIMVVFYLLYVYKKNKIGIWIILISSLVIPVLMIIPFLPGIIHVFLHFPVLDDIAVHFGYPKDYTQYFVSRNGFSTLFVSFLLFLKTNLIWTVAFFLAFGIVFVSKKRRLIKAIRKVFFYKDYLLTLIFILFFSNIIIHLVGSYSYCSKCIIPYFNYFSILGSVILGVSLSVVLKNIKEIYSKLFFIGLVLLIAFVRLRTLTGIFAKDYHQTQLQQIIIVSQDIKNWTNPSDKIFSLALPHYLYLSQREGFGPLINTEYSLRNSQNSNVLNKVGLWNFKSAEEWISNESDWVIISKNMAESIKLLSPDFESILMPLINNDFYLYKTISEASQGTIFVYKKRLNR